MSDLGEKILRVLVAYESDGLYSGQTWIGAIALRTTGAPTGSTDGRAIRAPLAKLVAAGLIERIEKPNLSFRPTERGREVDRILDEVVAERGGKFRPLRDVLEHAEIFALR